jgi:hypothetical protein
MVIIVMSSSTSLLLLLLPLLLGWDQMNHLGTARASGPTVPTPHAYEALVTL